jgi:hypothetical protein
MPKLDILEQLATENLQKFVTEDQKIAFAQALQASISLDMNGSTPPKPVSPYDISQRYGFSLEDQKNYRISLCKKDALTFLQEFGKTGLNTGFNKRFTESKYKLFFDRDRCAKVGKAIILTYAEWLHLADFRFEPVFPSVLKKHLNQ